MSDVEVRALLVSSRLRLLACAGSLAAAEEVLSRAHCAIAESQLALQQGNSLVEFLRPANKSATAPK